VSTFRDLDGVTHSTEVDSESLYESVAKALTIFRANDWAGPAAWTTGCVEVAVKEPEVRHKVLLKDFDSWLQRSTGSPREIVLRDKLKRILGT
jgi:hypothetical protein